jgi:hypothetical protein
MMQRRSFLATIAAALGTVVLDPEQLLWVPGEKLISIPAPPQRWIFNNNLRISAFQLNGFNGRVTIHRGNPGEPVMEVNLSGKDGLYHWFPGDQLYSIIASPKYPIIIEPEFRQQPGHHISAQYIEVDSNIAEQFVRVGSLDESETVALNSSYVIGPGMFSL